MNKAELEKLTLSPETIDVINGAFVIAKLSLGTDSKNTIELAQEEFNKVYGGGEWLIY